YVSALWYPKHDVSSNSTPFRHYFDPTFEHKLTNTVNQAIRDETASGFQWTSVTSFREASDNKHGSVAWIVFGGSIPNLKVHANSLAKSAVAVVGCQISAQENSPVGFKLDSCYPIEVSRVSTSNGKAGLLGFSIVSLELKSTRNTAVLVYCDPLWRHDRKHPGGGCRVRLRQDGGWASLANGEFDEFFRFCSSFNHSTPCGGGFSVDLLEVASGGNNRLSNTKMIVGLPFTQPHGEAQVIDNVLLRFQGAPSNDLSNVDILRSGELRFGTQVVWTPTQGNRIPAESPNSRPNANKTTTVDNQEIPEWWTRENLALVSSPSSQPWPTITAYRHTGFRASEVAFRIRLRTNDTLDFSGFGQTLETIRVPLSGQDIRVDYAIVVGAPFNYHPVKGPNTGRVYILCPKPGLVEQEVVSSMEGPEGQSFFGYSLANLGDVNGDGIDDIVVGAPGIQASSSQPSINGKVYIHRVTPQCTLDPIAVQFRTGPFLCVLRFMSQLLYLFCQLLIILPGLINTYWYPNHNASTDGIVYQHFIDSTLERKLTDSINNALGDAKAYAFQWVSVTGFRESLNSNLSITWIALGGSVPNRQANLTSMTKKAVAVVACALSAQKSSPVGFNLDDCHPIEVSRVSTSDHKAGLLGMSLRSLELRSTRSSSALVYCDPLWRDDMKHAGGGCRIRLRQDGRWTETATGEPTSFHSFCNSVDRSNPCGGGFSVDLLELGVNQNGRFPEAKLLVGLPFSQPFGEAQLINNALRGFQGLTEGGKQSVDVLQSEEVNFGTQVLWTPHQKEAFRSANNNTGAGSEEVNSVQSAREYLALVSSPSGKAGPSITAYRPNGFRASDVVFRIRPKISGMTTFSGFGQALETLWVPLFTNESRADYAIIVGAPFSYHSVKGPNTGRVYIVCPDLERIEQEIVGPNLDGPESYSFFGYSLARLGDIDGDGIDDIAIGAPGMRGDSNQNSVNGRVYVHRVTSDCKLAPVPLQVLEAPDKKPGDGFGIAVARGVDIDRDGWPELIVTALGEENKTTTSIPYIFTMPKHVRAHCKISVAAEDRSKELRKGSEIKVKILVSLNDMYSNELLPIPDGLTSPNIRVHQINPDVLWNERYTENANNVSYKRDRLEDFFQSEFPYSLDPDKPRFEVVGEPKPVRIRQGQMQILARLRARYEAQSIDLNIVPLRIAYRSFVRTEECASYRSEEKLCNKAEQPLVDWSECQANLVLNAPVCPGSPSGCSSDLRLSHIDDTLVHFSSAPRTVQIDFSKRRTVLRLQLENMGPTKATGVRIQIQTFGKLSSSPPAGVELQLTEVNITQAGVDATLSARPAMAGWMTHVSEAKDAVLITSRRRRSLHPNEPIWIDVGIFFAHLGTGTISTQELVNKLQEGGQLVYPGIQMRVFSETDDPDLSNNRISVNYQIVYKPRVLIGLGLQPASLIDHRKEPTVFAGAHGPRKVFSEDIGPKLEHTFVIENPGTTDLANLSLMLDLPFSTVDRKPLVYLVPEVRKLSQKGSAYSEWENLLPQIFSADGQSVGQCVVPTDYLNPLGLTVLDFDGSSHREPAEPPFSAGSQLLRAKRGSRNVGYIITRTEDFGDSKLEQVDPANEADGLGIKIRRSEKFRFQFSCDPRTTNIPTRCVSIKCTLTHLGKRDAVRLRWTGWLWAETYFNLQTPDVSFVSRLRVEHWGEVPSSLVVYKALENNVSEAVRILKFEYPTPPPFFELKQSIILRGVKPKITHRIPLWPFIVAIVAGIFVLTVLGICFYACGFFRRKSVKELKRRSAVHSQNWGDKSSSEALLTHQQDNSKTTSGSGPFVLATRHPLVVASVDARQMRPGYGENKRVKIHTKKRDMDSECLIQASPNLFCALEPEPPSPRLPAPEQHDRQHSTSSVNWSKDVEISDREVEEDIVIGEETASEACEDKPETVEQHTDEYSLNTAHSQLITSDTSDLAGTDSLLDSPTTETASTHSKNNAVVETCPQENPS
ncbi:FG-GAP repeat protein, partial [Opisthorchis viverrini]